jgi:hypothetical protein
VTIFGLTLTPMDSSLRKLTRYHDVRVMAGSRHA